MEERERTATDNLEASQYHDSCEYGYPRHTGLPSESTGEAEKLFVYPLCVHLFQAFFEDMRDIQAGEYAGWL